MVPHSVLLGGGLSIPLGGRTPSPQSPIPLQDRDSPRRGYGKLVIGCHDSERSRTSRGDTSETLDVALGRIMDEEDFKFLKTDIDSVSRPVRGTFDTPIENDLLVWKKYPAKMALPLSLILCLSSEFLYV